MGKLKNLGSRIISFLIGCISAFILIFLCRERNAIVKDNYEKEVEGIKEKAEKKKNEAIKRISSASVSDIADGYSSVCDAIDEGKERFRRRIKTAIDD